MRKKSVSEIRDSFMIIIDLDSDLVDRLLESFVSHWRLLATCTIGPKSI